MHTDPTGNPTTLERILSVLTRLVTLAIIPTFIVTQWLTVRFEIPARLWFNGTIGLIVLLLLVARIKKVKACHLEFGLAMAFSATIVVSALVNGVEFRTALQGAIPYLGFAAFAMATLAQERDAAAARRGVIVAAVAIAVAGAASLAQALLGRPAYTWLGQDSGYPRWWERGRSTGLAGNPARMAHIGLIVLTLAPLARSVAPLVLAGAALCVGTSGTRLAIAGGMALIGLWPWFRADRNNRTVWVGAAAIVGVFVIVQLALPSAREDLAARTDQAIEELGDDDATVEDVRVANMEATIRVWRAYPIAGTGPGRFGSTTAWSTRSSLHEEFGLPDVRSEEFAAELAAAGDTREIDVGTAQLDLGWFQILAELGTLGVVLAAAMLGALARRAFALRRFTATALILILAILSVGGPGLVDPSLAAVVFWWIGVDLSLASDGSHSG